MTWVQLQKWFSKNISGIIFSGEQKGTREGQRMSREAEYVQQRYSWPVCNHVNASGIIQRRGHYPILWQYFRIIIN